MSRADTPYKLPRNVFAIRKTRRTYFYYQQRRGSPAAGPLIRIHADPGSEAFGLEVRKAAGESKKDTRATFSGPGYVYFFVIGGAVKIGFSKQPFSRFRTLQTGVVGAIEAVAIVRGTMRAEKRLHAMFAEQRINGEWFTIDAKIGRLIGRSLGSTASLDDLLAEE